MPHFSHAKDTTIHGGSFTDVQGDHIVVQGNLSVNESEEGILALKAASSLGATHDSLERVPPPKCQPGTRKIPLSRIDAWMEDMENACRRATELRGEEPVSSGPASPGDTVDQGRILWLHGPAGAGKSAVAHTISEKYALGQKLVASFFFSRDTPGRDVAKHVFPTIAYQISMNIPGMRTIIGSAIQRDPSIFTKSLETQVQQLIVRPFKSLASSTSTPTGGSPFLVILDGIDECRNKDDHRRILRLLADILYKYRLPLGFVVVSRPEQHIMQTLRSSVFLDHGITEELSLYADINRDETHLDVRAFLLAEFKRIALSYNHRCMKPLPEIWPSTATIDLLVTKSGGYFIYVTTIIRFVDKEFFSPVERLERILNAPSSDESPMGELDRLYQQILSTNPRTDLLVRILGAIFVPCPPPGIYPIPSLTFEMIECLFGANDGTVLSMLDGMHSLLRVEGATVKPFHASFKDFLFDETRAGSFFVELQKHHGDMALNFLTNIAQYEAKSAHSDRLLLSLTWPFHASHASDLSVVTGKLRAISNAQWRVVIDSFKQYPRHILYMLREAMVWLQHLEDPGPNLALRMTSLLDYAFTQRLMDPGVDNTFIQELFNLSGNGIMSFSRRDVIEDVRHARADSIFESFMNNSERSAGVFDDHALCHARLAFGCMNLLIGEKFGYYYQHSDRVHNRWTDTFTGCVPGTRLCALHRWDFYFRSQAWKSDSNRDSLRKYSRENWTTHLSRSRPGDKLILHLLRDSGKQLLNHLHPSQYRNSCYKSSVELHLASNKEDLAHAALVLEWLQGMQRPPRDLLRFWTPCKDCGKLHDINADYLSLFPFELFWILLVWVSILWVGTTISFLISSLFSMLFELCIRYLLRIYDYLYILVTT